jgi:AraC-like DNA-binding protein
MELAERTGMSRSIFALKFKETVGTTPMEYLTRWRMLLARDRLTNSADPAYPIARLLGYESQSGFSKAFKNSRGRNLARTYRWLIICGRPTVPGITRYPWQRL